MKQSLDILPISLQKHEVKARECDQNPLPFPFYTYPILPPPPFALFSTTMLLLLCLWSKQPAKSKRPCLAIAEIKDNKVIQLLHLFYFKSKSFYFMILTILPCISITSFQIFTLIQSIESILFYICIFI